MTRSKACSVAGDVPDCKFVVYLGHGVRWWAALLLTGPDLLNICLV